LRSWSWRTWNKSETNPKEEIFETSLPRVVIIHDWFAHCSLRISCLFRISDFGFRIFRSMNRIFVQVWCEVDPTLNLRVDRQTGLPIADNGDQLIRVSPLGRSGITAALEIPGAELVAFALGDGHDAALRHALAAGASQAVQLDAAGSVSEWLRVQKPDLVIADRIAGGIAAQLRWSHLAGLDQLRVENGQLHAIRQLGRGDCEVVTARLPAIVRLQTETPRLRYVSAARIALAASKPIERLEPFASTATDAQPELGPLQLARPRTKLGMTPTAAPASGMDRISALMGIGRGATTSSVKTPEPTQKNPEQLADEFVRYLAHHHLLDDSKPHPVSKGTHAHSSDHPHHRRRAQWADGGHASA
jgi:electron transfer flavoprotein alpha/beta subunit